MTISNNLPRQQSEEDLLISFVNNMNSSPESLDNLNNLLIWACANGKLRLTGTILAKEGVNIDYCSPSSHLTPLSSAICNKQTYIVQYLLEKNANINLQIPPANHTPLQLSLFNYEEAIFNSIIDDNRLRIDDADINGNTALYIALSHGDDSLARIKTSDKLLDKGADPTIISEEGLSALHSAIYAIAQHKLGDEGTSIALLEKILSKFTPEILNNTNKVPYLHFAISHKQNTVFYKLINAGADLAIKDFGKNTPLHLAVYFNQKELVEKCLAMGGNITYLSDDEGTDYIDSQNSAGETPLHIAVRSGKTDMAITLIENGAVLNISNNENKTPIDLAITAKSSMLVLKYLEYGFAPTTEQLSSILDFEDPELTDYLSTHEYNQRDKLLIEVVDFFGMC